LPGKVRHEKLSGQRIFTHISAPKGWRTGRYAMKNREEILAAIKEIMIEMFEIDEKAITLEARLNEDLDFDSIDAVDMMVKLKEMTGKAVKSEDFKAARTIRDIVEAVYKMLNN
jgi:acyl carrier protein